MTYELGTVRSRIEQKLDDTSFGVDKLNQFINDGQRYILNSRRFTFMELEADVTTEVGSSLLTGYPTNVQTPLSIRVYSPSGNATVLSYVEYEDFDYGMPNPSIVGNGKPSLWYIFNGVVNIYPSADAEYTLRLKYIKEPAELTVDASIPEVPESFGEVLVLTGYKRALEHNDDFDQAQIIQQQIDEQMTLLDERHKRQSGQPHIMRQLNRRR